MIDRRTPSPLDQLLQVEAWIRWRKPADQIAQRCEEIAQAYLAQPLVSEMYRRDCHMMAELLREMAEIYRQKALPANAAKSELVVQERAEGARCDQDYRVG